MSLVRCSNGLLSKNCCSDMWILCDGISVCIAVRMEVNCVFCSPTLVVSLCVRWPYSCLFCRPQSDTMTLLKAVNRTHKLLPYEQLYIQKYHHKDILIPEPQFFDNNPLLHFAKDTKGYDSPTTTDQ